MTSSNMTADSADYFSVEHGEFVFAGKPLLPGRAEPQSAFLRCGQQQFRSEDGDSEDVARGEMPRQ